MCAENQYTDKGGNSKNSDLLDYAWKWFEYHAKQRISMFNYFLIVSGILANAYVHILSSDCFGLAAALAFAGALTGAAFFVLDLRNARLVYLAEDVLRKLEVSVLFPEDLTGLSEEEKQTPRGILFRELREKKGRWTRHKYWLRIIEGLIFVCFVSASIFAFWLDP